MRGGREAVRTVCRRTSLSTLGLIFVLSACGGSEPESTPEEQPRLVFVRGGVLASPGSGGRAVGGDRELVLTDWTSGSPVTVGGRTDPAPVRAECVPLFSSDLGDVDSLVSRGITTPGTSLAFSPDGDRLAVGTYLGEIRVLDAWTGREIARRKLAETMVKRVAWSPDGATVYAAEQSPDAYVHALVAEDLTSRWSFRLADELETSPPPPATSIYGVFTLPAAYGLEVLEGGDLIVAGTHAWPVADEKLNRARIYRLRPDGTVAARFPADAPADATFKFPRIDAEGGRLVFSVGRSATGTDPTDLPIDGVQVLNLSDLSPSFAYSPEPLLPHFKRASAWEALDLLGDTVLAGFGDGRVLLVPTAGGDVTTLELGTPVVTADIPVAASVGWGQFLRDGGLLANTGTSNIPWGSDVPADRPPAAHPGENTLHVFGPGGVPRWAWRAEPALQGITVSPDGTRVLVGGGPRQSDHRTDLFGGFVLRLGGEGTGAERLEASCATDGPVFFSHAMTDDGRVAVSEVPFKDESGTRILGDYRVTVLR